MLECKNQTFYTGITNNLDRRLEEHKQGKGGHYTKSFGADKFIYSEPYQTKQDALRRESQIKGWTRKKKLALINGDLELLKKL